MATKKRELANGDKIACPYCGKPGVVMKSHEAVSIIHATGKRKILTAGGVLVEVESFLDGCSNEGKIGANNHRVEVAAAPVEEEF